ncbi:uncharacterized protein LOC127751508 [Frankliniella occidentalis]|uniref:Uncharacterized protein LOC127751508 n=1 Tax=Frankliniella occidentalis TaxID=133901 RepID=A0A9C6X8C1_FRAOC|nr:uncharacterized protein LOC127751508 [Frankliniella occidentalis]
MTRKCYVCQKKDGQGTHFFSLPKDIEVQNKWKQWISKRLKCDIKSIPKSALLCSDHFNPDHIMSRKLKAGSVPVESIDHTHDSPRSSTSDARKKPQWKPQLLKVTQHHSVSSVIPLRTSRKRFENASSSSAISSENNPTTTK